MNLKNQYRLRVKNCIGTIIDVHNSVCEDYEGYELLDQFHTLREAVEYLDMSIVSEGDILMVERATNALLREFKDVFQSEGWGIVCRELDS
ncbi:MAG: hypothetical protein JRK53_02570 [Deltaproteobacteria bacterium]|nr:hypothetical protein [Deltaproteobacteria bacterium]MBW1816262.1 hypothetical protein [Deltaproteobacteria bacterium]